MKTLLQRLCGLALLLVVVGCSTPQPFDYTAFKEHRPRSILILPPLNESPEVEATYSMLAQMTQPLAESGYYVVPVTLMDETFKQNGISSAADIHALPPSKLREIFGADAALYVTVQKYGASYRVVDSVTQVSATARLMDLKSQKTLWHGSASASNQEGSNNNSAGLVGLLITAIANQVISNVTNSSHPVAGVTSQRLLSAGRPSGMLYGPRSPNYLKD